MYLSKDTFKTKLSMNLDYFFCLLTFFVYSVLILIVLIIVILICTSYRRKKKVLMNGSKFNGDCGVFVINKPNDNKIVNVTPVEKSNHSKENSNNLKDKSKSQRYVCCLKSRTESLINLEEEGFMLIDGEGKIMNIEIRDKDLDVENILHTSMGITEDKTDYDNGRLSHIDRELPPLPLLNVNSQSNMDQTDSLVKDNMITSMSGSLKYSDLDQQTNKEIHCSNTSSADVTLSRQQSDSRNQSPVIFHKFGSDNIASRTCCCGNQVCVPSADDLSSNDYDPTYAAIRRTKVSCSICGAPSVYTPVTSNRNSNLSLQLNSCLVSPVRCTNIITQHNESPYASIAKLPKNGMKRSTNQDQEIASCCSTIKRQRSISHGDIKSGSLMMNNKLHQNDIIKHFFQGDGERQNEKIPIFSNKGPANYMSLWNLMVGNRNGSFNMFPIIPERTYGQSVVDLVQKLRASEDPEAYNLIHSVTDSNFRRCYTPPILFGNSFKRRSSLHNFNKGSVWTPQSCQMIHGSSFYKSGFLSPLKIFDRDSTQSRYDYDFPDTLGKTFYKQINSLSKKTFQPVLTPPLSPMDCEGTEKDITLHSLQLNESKYENPSFFTSESIDDDTIKKSVPVYEDLDSEGLVSEKEAEVIITKDIDHYEYLPDSVQLVRPDYTVSTTEKSVSYTSNVQTLPTRPISIVLYGDDLLQKDNYFNYRFENLEVYDVSSIQMSPLMEQSLENSSSKTTLSSLGYQQFNRLMSSEDSCAKSPPSAEASPSLDKLEISPDDHNFMYNDFHWSNFNSAFDDYETFE